MANPIIEPNGIDLIAEEGKTSLGHRLAGEYGIEPIKITMPHDERRRRNISPYYESIEGTRRVAYEQFEEYMFQKVKQKNASVILLMCGWTHLQALQKRFSEAGDRVRTYDVNDCPWFQGVPVGPLRHRITFDHTFSDRHSRVDVTMNQAATDLYRMVISFSFPISAKCTQNCAN